MTRRRLLRSVALAGALAPLAVSKLSAAVAAVGPRVNPAEPAAKAVKYVEDAKHAQGAAAGSKCANCALYQGAGGSAQGPCQIFPGKEVMAAGWCSSWAPQMQDIATASGGGTCCRALGMNKAYPRDASPSCLAPGPLSGASDDNTIKSDVR